MLSTQKLIEQLASLPLEGRAQIVDTLLRSLNQPDPAIDRAWAEEAQSRLDEIRAGKVQGIPAEDVFNKARERC